MIGRDEDGNVPGVEEARAEFSRETQSPSPSEEVATPGLAAMRRAMDKYDEALRELAK